MLNPCRIPSSVSALVLLAIGASTLAAQSRQASPQLLDSIAGAGVRQNRAIGLVAAVVRGNDTLLMNAYGRADVEWDVPMTTDAMFEVGSIAKQFGAVSILQLRDAGKLSLDDPITKWLPFLGTSGSTVTLRHLLNHTSGIYRFSDERAWEINMFLPGLSRDSAYRLIKLDPFQFPTGTAQAYSNSAFWLLGVVVEKASGMQYEDYLQQKIFDPLGMKRSMFCNAFANVPRRAHGYGMGGGMIRRAPVVAYTWVFTPGAVCSTAGDMVIWLKALHGGKVLSPKSYAEMTTPSTLSDGTALQYGLGIKVGEDYRGLKYIGHGGTAPGFRADATWYPDAQMAVVVLMNTSPASISPGGVGGELARAVLPLPRPDFTYYPGNATELVGRYQYVAGGNQSPFSIEVAQTPTGLTFTREGAGRAERLPWAGGLKFYAQENVTLTFRRTNGDRGPVTELQRDDAGNLVILRKQQ